MITKLDKKVNPQDLLVKCLEIWSRGSWPIDRFGGCIKVVAPFIDNNLFPEWKLRESALYIKPAFSKGFIDWHLDRDFWNQDGFTVTIALTDMLENNGGLRFASMCPISPPLTIMKEGNLELGKSECYPLLAGEMLKHDSFEWHGSDSNKSNLTRISLAVVYDL